MNTAGKGAPRTCVTFVSGVANQKGIKQQLGLERIVLPVSNCRNVGDRPAEAVPDVQRGRNGEMPLIEFVCSEVRVIQAKACRFLVSGQSLLAVITGPHK